MQSNGHIENTTKDNNEFKPSINEPHVVEDEQLRALPGNEEEKNEEILLPSTTAVKTTKPKVSSSKRKSSLGRRRDVTSASAGTTKQLERQATQLGKITVMLHSIQKDMKSTKGQSATVTDKAATSSDVPYSEKYRKEKFYYSYYFIKKKDKT